MSAQRVKRYFIYITGLFIAFLAIYAILRNQARPAANFPFFRQDKFLVIAHRGGRSLGPEGTMYTFERAVALGVDVLEMDLRVTGDHKLVVLHDATVDRTTEGTGEVVNFTLSDLKSLDAGFRWSPDNGTSFPLRAKSIQIPTLEEVLEAFPQVRMNIEIKGSNPAVATSLCDLIQKHNMTADVMVACFEADLLKQFRGQCPRVATSAGFAEAFTFYFLQKLHLQSVFSPTALALQVPEKYGDLRVVDREFIAAAHQRNLRVHVWTVNKEDDMCRLTKLGVDGIITDYPQQLMEVFEKCRKSR